MQITGVWNGGAQRKIKRQVRSWGFTEDLYEKIQVVLKALGAEVPSDLY